MKSAKFFIRVILGFKDCPPKKMDIETSENLSDIEIALLAEEMFPNYIKFNPSFGMENDATMVLLINNAISYSVCKFN